MSNLTGINLEYARAGWINNMSARGTYETIYHLLRWADYALSSHDKRQFTVAIRMIQSYVINEPTIARKALETYKNARR